LQDELARIIVNKLRESIAEKPATQQFVKQATDNLDAYSLYLKGNYFRNKLTPPDVQKAIFYYEETIRLDPHFAQANGNLAGCYIQLGAMGQIHPGKAFELAKKYADKALELDSGLGDAYSIKGGACMVHDWDWNTAYKYLIKGLELNPGSDVAAILLAVYHQCMGRSDKAVEVLEKALPYDPLSVTLIASLAEKCFLAGHYTKAEQYIEKLLELDPGMRHALEVKGYCHAMRGDWDTAIKLFEEVHHLTNHPLKGLAPLGYAYGRTGQTEKAMECISKIDQRQVEEPGFVKEPDLALIWWGIGNKDKAFENLFIALDKKMPVVYGLYSPLYQGITDDPRFDELKRMLKLPVEVHE